jgi:hypothetical protein
MRMVLAGVRSFCNLARFEVVGGTTHYPI